MSKVQKVTRKKTGEKEILKKTGQVLIKKPSKTTVKVTKTAPVNALVNPKESERDFFAQQLHEWGTSFGRKGLPWQVKDPYRVWLSEIMLQQTQVQTVKEYYARFLKHFPTVADLAKATETEVLEQWAGLGYYTRGRNLLKAAKMIMDQYGGGFPKKREELMHLPGVGKSTAAAIASICFGEPVSILDANALRVITRYLGVEQDISKQNVIKPLWDIADTLVYSKDTQLHTQSLMDLGAMVCVPKSPNCKVCPLKPKCRANLEATIEKIPFKNKIKKERPKQTEKWYLLSDASIEHVWLFKSEDLMGTFQTDPNEKQEEGDASAKKRKVWQGLLQCASDKIGGPLQIQQKEALSLGGMVHKFSHFDLDFTVHLVRLNEGQIHQCERLGGQKIGLDGTKRLAIPKPVQWSIDQLKEQRTQILKKRYAFEV